MKKIVKRASTAIAISALAVFFGCCAAAAAQADDGNSGGVGLTVVVGTAEPVAEPVFDAGDSVGIANPILQAQPPAATGPEPSAIPSAGNASDLGGIVYLSGLTSRSVWSGNIVQSAAELQFTVRNISTAEFDSSARFWVQTTVGNRVGSTPEVRISKLAPGETRVIRATVTGLGQWAVLHAYVDYTPPASVLGVALMPTQRDGFIFLPPVAVGGVGALGAAALLAGNTLPAGRLLRSKFGFSR